MMKALPAFFVLATLVFPPSSLAADPHTGHHPHHERPQLELHYPLSASECRTNEVWDAGMAMCMPLPTEGMPLKMAMLRGNGFAAGIFQQGPRGRDAFAAPGMVMLDLGRTWGSRHYLNLDIMATLEKWTLPSAGYPELLQVGEHDTDGNPYLDAQHPHSSPLMGLTLSDTIRLDTGGSKDHLKIFFAPRGESTDGPIAFMHRPTGIANPDAPLGHHIGQDVGHITSTVIGASLQLGDTRVEASTFNGSEPEPTRVDLPIGAPNSVALRLIQDFSPSMTAMVSGAYVREPEHDDPTLPFVGRFSASLQNRTGFGDGWRLHHALVAGLITKYDRAATLLSFLDETWLHRGASRIFTRLELLQRTPAQLGIPAIPEQDSGRWLAAGTLGFTRALTPFDGGELALGGSITKDLLPGEFIGTYGGNPWSGKIFLQLTGMKMWHSQE